MTSVVLHEGDNRESLRRLIDEGVRVHSVVTDPPYGLVSTVKRFGKNGSAAAKSEGATGVFKRASGGFMGQEWDASGIERDPEFWKLIHDILLPGGYVLAFSSPRTGHWQACAMETAGFVMHPFLGWTYGSGFPKAHNASKAVDKELGATRPVHGYADVGPDMTGDNYARGGGERRVAALTSAGSPEAAQWEGWAYGAQALKPALEPIYVGQKPFSEKNGALNLMKQGVGAINIDGCRVGTSGARNNGRKADSSPIYGDFGASQRVDYGKGRHPANLLHDSSDEVVAMFPDSNGQRSALKGCGNKRQSPNGTYGEFPPAADCEPRNDSGSAARFFNSFPLDTDPLFYHSKATKADRAGSKHPTVKPVNLMRWLCRLVTPKGGTVLDPFGGSGTTGEAARLEGFDCILMEAEKQFIADIRKRFDLEEPIPDFGDFLGGEDQFADLLG